MGKTRDIVKKMRDIQQTFHARMGMIKDKNGMDLTETEEIKEVARIYRRTIQKGLNDPDNHNGMVTDLESDIPESEVKWASGSITMDKASEGDGIPAELFQILKMVL